MADQKGRTSEVTFKVQLDENNVPQSIDWIAQDGNIQSRCKAMMISVWDEKENNTLRLDLWTRDMYVEEMRLYFHQSIMTMADTFQRATGDDKLAQEMRDFGKDFGEKAGLQSGQN